VSSNSSKKKKKKKSHETALSAVVIQVLGPLVGAMGGHWGLDKSSMPSDQVLISWTWLRVSYSPKEMMQPVSAGTSVILSPGTRKPSASLRR
jgi:hypothetical protein